MFAKEHLKTLWGQVSYCCSAALWRFLLKLVARVQIIGTETAPRGPYLMVGNHTSHFDPHTLASFYSQPVNFMAVRDLFTHPLTRLYFRSVSAFPVNRNGVDAEAVREALRRLKASRIVALFPEAGIRSGKNSILGEVTPSEGAAALAQMAGVKMRVCLVIGLDQLYAWKNLFRRPRVFIHYGPMLELDSSLPPKAARTKLNAEMVETFRALYRQFLKQAQPPPEMLPCTAQERWRRGR
ncbi:MAG: lysophospholipid acyltransferase family protein [bacterium]